MISLGAEEQARLEQLKTLKFVAWQKIEKTIVTVRQMFFFGKTRLVSLLDDSFGESSSCTVASGGYEQEYGRALSFCRVKMRLVQAFPLITPGSVEDDPSLGEESRKP